MAVKFNFKRTGTRQLRFYRNLTKLKFSTSSDLFWNWFHDGGKPLKNLFNLKADTNDIFKLEKSFRLISSKMKKNWRQLRLVEYEKKETKNWNKLYEEGKVGSEWKDDSGIF